MAASPIPKTGKLPPVGNTVDVKTATYTNDIGDTQLSAVWTDPDFDPTRAGGLLRARAGDPDAALVDLRLGRSGLPIPERCPATIQERAWSSPIWYTPEAN